MVKKIIITNGKEVVLRVTISGKPEVVEEFHRDIVNSTFYNISPVKKEFLKK